MRKPLMRFVTGDNPFIPVDIWEPMEEECEFKGIKDFIILDLSKYYGTVSETLNRFNISAKKCYNNEKDMKKHMTHYLNYFIKFYDPQKELIHIYAHIKFMMNDNNYTKEMLLNDIFKYVFSVSMMIKIGAMNEDNYSLNLDPRSNIDPIVRYDNNHGLMMMKMSLMMIIIIPLLTHFITLKRISGTDRFLLEVFEKIILEFDMDLYSKLYETSITTINKNKTRNPIWKKQSIRGINATTHAIESIENIILNIMPKYRYDSNIVNFNYQAIQNSIRFRITRIEYEFDFMPLSSSKRDEENNSEYDKFETYLTKSDESLYLQNKVNYQETMKRIYQKYGPFEQEEIKYYSDRLTIDNISPIHEFQKKLIFSLFYREFGDTQSILALNAEDYIVLMIATKRILESHSMFTLAYVISSKIDKLVPKKHINIKEIMKVTASSWFAAVHAKFNNEKIEKDIFSTIASITVSTFRIIDYNNQDLTGRILETTSDNVSTEMMMFVMLV